MDDLISRQAAIDALNKLDVGDGVGISSIACSVQESAISAIQHLPSTDAAEVVRCKDCIHYEPNTEELDAWCNAWGNTTICDGYCFCGEQKDD